MSTEKLHDCFEVVLETVTFTTRTITPATFEPANEVRKAIKSALMDGPKNFYELARCVDALKFDHRIVVLFVVEQMIEDGELHRPSLGIVPESELNIFDNWWMNWIGGAL